MRTLPRRTAILIAALLALTAYAATFEWLMRHRRHDISWFVVAGRMGVNPDEIPPGLSIIPGVDGYDGVAFYRLALDPFTRRQTDFGITLDTPPYRQQRLIYPLLVHILSLGNAAWVPTLLVVVNLIAVVVLTAAAAVVAAQHGLSPLWGILVPLYPGFFIAFSRDTSELVAWAFALSAIAAFGERRHSTGTLLLTLAILSRETTLIVAIAIAVAYVWRRRERVASFVIPLAVYVCWQLALRLWWGTAGVEAGAPDIPLPFSGYASVLAESAARRTLLMRIHFAECVFLALVAVTVAISFRRTSAAVPWRIAWVAYLGLAAILGRDVWSEHIAFMRVLSDLFAISAVILLGATARARLLVLLATIALSSYVMFHMR